MSKFTIREAGWNELTSDPDGPTGRMMFHTLDAIAEDVRQRQQARIGKVVYRTTSGVTRNAQGLIGSVQMRGTQPHTITGRPLLYFKSSGRGRPGPSGKVIPKGGLVVAHRVNHPGSKPPSHYLLEALRTATVRA